MNARRSLSVLVFLSVFLAGQSALPARAFITPTIRYAIPGGATSGACMSWATGCDLQYAISVASSVDQVWVKRGTYKPTPTSDRTISFVLKNGTAIYGGFAGFETMLAQRNWFANITILSGEIGDPATTVDNSYHVVTGSGTDSTAVLDGFFIILGNANNTNNLSTQDIGGGMYNNAGSPTLNNLFFAGNAAYTGGGAMANWINSNLTLTNGWFLQNTATDGGAMYNETSSPTLTNVTFESNTASGSFGGGAMFNDGTANPTLDGATFNNNTASTGPGGGMVNQDGSSPSVYNATFYHNEATGHNGGGVYNTNGSPLFINVTFSQNVGSAGAGMFDDATGAATIKDSIFWNDTTDEIANAGTGTSAILDSIVKSTCGSYNVSCNNVKSVDPLLGPLQGNGGFTKTMAIAWGSPAMDAGNDLTCSNHDQRGLGRPKGLHCDMGAYEVAAFVISGNTGFPGTRLGYNDGMPRTATADDFGHYAFAVPPGWSGTISPFFIGQGFTPPMGGVTRLGDNRVLDFSATGLPAYGKFDDTDPHWAYDGPWSIINNAAFFNNTLHVSTTPGAGAEFPFWGNEIKVDLMQSTGWGHLDFHLDTNSTPYMTVNLNAPTGLTQISSNVGVPGPHTITFEQSGPGGAPIGIDAITIAGPTPLGPGLYDFSDPAWSYTGIWSVLNNGGFYNNTLHMSPASGSSAILFFNGSGFQLNYLQGPTLGNVAFYLDGSPTPYGALSTNGVAYNVQTYLSPPLAPGLHMLKLTSAGGGMIGLDSITILP